MARELPPDKAAARRVIRAERRHRRAGATDEVWRQLALDLVAHVERFLAAGPAPGTVAIYESLPTEPPTHALADALRAAGARLLVPRLLADNDLTWLDRASDADLGVEAVAEADVVVVPALAIGHDGNRLGQGGGSYDRVLPRIRPGIPVLAVIFDDEFVGAVPHEPHDRPVDAVLTPTDGVRRLRPG